MPKVLTQAQVEQFREEGYVAGIPVITPQEAADAVRTLQAWEKRTGKVAREYLRGKAHLLIKVLSEITHKPRVVDAIADALGPDVLCIESGFFWKNARDPNRVTWHQDNSYLKLDPPLSLVAWIALTDSKKDNGALKVIPGSQKLGELPYDMVPGENNMLRLSRQVRGFDESKAIHLELEPGEMSLHANGVVHGSEPNSSDRPRIGWTLVCTRPGIRPGAQGFVSGTVLTGRNDERIYANEPIPTGDFDPVAVAAYDRAMEGPVKLYKPK
jgi:non-haem Fe2+, alpha-ketoglutarate-dependent halogenase